MSVIPIFIIVHNQYEYLKKIVSSYENNINHPIEIIFHNVDSMYYETLEYLKNMEKKGYKVYNSNVNNHHTVLNSIKDYIKNNPTCEYCIVTDPDIELINVDKNILDVYIYALNLLKVNSVGPMLDINDIPDYYYNKQAAITGHTKQFWSKPINNLVFEDKTYQYINCNTDTTFQLFSSKNIPKTFPYNNCVRFLSPLSARHLDWFIDCNNLSPCQIYYNMNNSKISHWNNKDWSGIYNGVKLNNIYTNMNVKYKYIYYYDKCKCKNNFNFGDMITDYIYTKLTNKKAINDINGGKNKEFVVVGAGSIMNSVKTNSIVWGTGCMFGNEKIPQPHKILSVRGPLTRNHLIKQNIKCPEIYGDIGLILPYFYNPKVDCIYDIGIIPHYIDVEQFHNIYKNIPTNIKIIDITDPIETFIKNVKQCKYILSSSLHGVICAHAYNKKCMWIKITNKIGGGNFKYRDYYGSVNVDNYNKIEPFLLNKYIDTNDLIKLVDNYPNPQFPIHTKHILELCPFI
jgi:pyruvyltransferase